MKGKCLLQSGAKVQEDLDFNEGLFTLFSANNTYQVGNVVRYQDGLYRCHTAVATAGPWTGDTNWTKTTVDALFGGIQSGTKLYKHKLSYTQPSATIYFITTSPTPLVTASDRFTAFNSASCLSARYGSDMELVVGFLAANNYDTVYAINRDMITPMQIGGFSGDTVTAL